VGRNPMAKAPPQRRLRRDEAMDLNRLLRFVIHAQI